MRKVRSSTGSRVKIREEDGQEHEVLIRSSAQRSFYDISADSPLGRALLGHRVGDQVTVEVIPTIARVVTVLSVD